jgi:gliding motility-associated-like protein
VNISEPALQLNGDNFRILKGSDVALNAAGAERYEWSPSTGLSQTNIPNPIASPSLSIQYVVTGYDSLGCSVQATVNIMVEGAGFIPTLFTPNDDGKNDQLKIYGMPAVKNFTLSIYNREGSLVFRTSNVSEAVQSGWDGSKNGTKQPQGVYFWKVEGEIASGGKILLNGKDSGSIVLVR